MALIYGALGLSEAFVRATRLVYLYLFFVGAWKEHTVNLVAIWSIYKELFAFECF